MHGWRLVRRVLDGDGSRRLDIEASDKSLFRYTSYSWQAAADEDEGALGDGYWTQDRQSGLFGSLELCERDARSSIKWFR